MMEYWNNGTMDEGKEGGRHAPYPIFQHSTIPAFPSLRFGPTDAGKVILRGIVFIGLATLIIPAFDVLCVLVSVCLVALVVGFVLRPRIVVTGNLPERIIAGQTAHLTYTIKNTGRLTAYNLRLRFRALPEAIEQRAEAHAVGSLGPGQAVDAVVAIRPVRRGCYRLQPPVCESSYPFSLFHFGTSRAGEEPLVVLPAFSWLDLPLPCVSRHVNASSLRPAGRIGNSPEYIGNRPYQRGDPPRRIDVRAWARLSVPATKEYDDDLDNYAALVLDTRVPPERAKSKSGEVKELEAAISLCASVAYSMQRDCLIDLLLAGGDLHSFASLPKGMRVDRVHEALAAVEPAEGYSAEQIGTLWEDRLREISEIVFLVLHWDRTYQQLVEWAELAGCHCTVIIVGEPDSQEGEKARTKEGRNALLPSDPLALSPSSVLGNVRYVSADDILAGRRSSL
jgi:uncharacterized protein (DUF58 family)